MSRSPGRAACAVLRGRDFGVRRVAGDDEPGRHALELVAVAHPHLATVFDAGEKAAAFQDAEVGEPVLALLRGDDSMYVSRRISSQDVLDQLYELFMTRGTPEYIRSDNGPEFTAQAVRTWLEVLKVRTLFIEPGSPWENGYVQSFIGKLRDELLNGEIFDTLLEARVVMGDWKKEYNQIRPHSSLGYRPPAPVTYSVEKFNLGVVH
jgi:putative transposase